MRLLVVLNSHAGVPGTPLAVGVIVLGGLVYFFGAHVAVWMLCKDGHHEQVISDVRLAPSNDEMSTRRPGARPTQRRRCSQAFQCSSGVWSCSPKRVVVSLKVENLLSTMQRVCTHRLRMAAVGIAALYIAIGISILDGARAPSRAWRTQSPNVTRRPSRRTIARTAVSFYGLPGRRSGVPWWV